ncbi:hypothetical protein TNCV_3695721 [Trichonephila clavipes]|nr:hypothetical protein TNCV_3695721 [Trichonephila clavipes]
MCDNTSKEVCSPSAMREDFLVPVDSGKCGIKLVPSQEESSVILCVTTHPKEVCSPSAMREDFLVPVDSGKCGIKLVPHKKRVL